MFTVLIFLENNMTDQKKWMRQPAKKIMPSEDLTTMWPRVKKIEDVEPKDHSTLAVVLVMSLIATAFIYFSWCMA